MRPVIGIICDAHICPPERSGGRTYDIIGAERDYINAIEAAGGAPLLLPTVEEQSCALRLVEVIDGLMLTGGSDIDPALYREDPKWVLGAQDEDRDRAEVWLVREALDKNMPILGICRGSQILNVVAGGSLYQDVRLFPKEVIKHSQLASGWHPTHSVKIDPDSKLFKVIGESPVRVNSFHHQSIKDVAKGFKATAWASDGIVEAIESEEHSFVLGVQFHPEYMWQKHPKMANLFKAFIQHTISS